MRMRHTARCNWNCLYFCRHIRPKILLRMYGGLSVHIALVIIYIYIVKAHFKKLTAIFYVDRCKCNGHASRCLKHVTAGGYLRRTCNCEHFTSGPDCNECLPTHNDAPWGRATAEDAHECQSKLSTVSKVAVFKFLIARAGVTHRDFGRIVIETR